MSDLSVDNLLPQVRRRESGNRYDLPTTPWELSQGSHASGAYRFQPGTWRQLTGESGIGTQYAEAYQAPPDVQDAVARYAATHYNPNSSFLWGASGPYARTFEEAAQGRHILVQKPGPPDPTRDPNTLLALILSDHQKPTEQEAKTSPHALLAHVLAQEDQAAAEAAPPPQQKPLELPAPPTPQIPAAPALEPVQPTKPLPALAQAEPPKSGGDLLNRILGAVSPISTAQAAERVEPPLLKTTPTPEMGGAAVGAPRSPLPPSSIGVGHPGPQPMQPPLPGAAATGQELAEGIMLQGASGGIHAGGAPPTGAPPRQTTTVGPQPGFPASPQPQAGTGGAGQPPPPRQPPGAPPPPPGAAPTPTPRIPSLDRRGAERAADVIRDLFWPKGWAERRMGREQARATLREERGRSEQAKTSAVAQLEEFRAQGTALGQEFDAWLKGGKVGPEPQAMRLINDIEGKQPLPPGDPLKPLATALKRLYQKTRSDIEASLPDFDHFIDGYYRHLWEETAKGDPPNWGNFKTGSSASTKRRTIPTIEEGLNAGYTPVHKDPVENTLHYIAGMQDFLAFQRAAQAGKDMGYVSSTAPQGKGWVPLSTRGGATQYAEPGFAKIWNYYYGTNWNIPHYQSLLRAANTVTAFKLGLSGYHAWNIAQEAAVAGLANSIGRIRSGELAKGLKDMGYSVTLAPQVAHQLDRGGKLQRIYLDLDTGTNMDRTLMDLYARAGGRAVGRGQEYRPTGMDTPRHSAMDNYFTAFRRGKIKVDLMSQLRDIRGDALTESLTRRIGFAPFRTAKLIANEMTRLTQTITAPLFDTMIPRIKVAAWADEMESWLGAHPNATHEEQLAQARKLVDTMDDRFGEMVQDNLFWHPLLRQTFNLTATSIGWEFGSLRAFGGAAKDIMSGRPLSPRGRWALAFPTILVISSAVYEYLKTGKRPGDDEGNLVSGGALKNAFFPRTGGVTPEGAPERALLPGYVKDPVQWYKHLKGAGDFASDGDMTNAVIAGSQGVANWMVNRLNPAGQMASGLVTGKDFFGRQIRDSFYGPFRGYAGFVLEQFMPIPLVQENLRGSNISQAERFAGVRPAPAMIEDPAREDLFQLKNRLNELKKEYFGLFAHGRRTDISEAELRRQGKVLKDEMETVAGKIRDAQKRYRAMPRTPPPKGDVNVTAPASPR